MISSKNLLGIQEFGAMGITIGNIVSEGVAQQGFKTQYNPITRKITVLSSSNLPQEALYKVIYDSSVSSEYDGWYPVIDKERDSDGNLRINFSYSKPNTEPFAQEENWISSLVSKIDTESFAQSTSSLIIIKDTEPFPLVSITDTEPFPQVKLMEICIFESVIIAMNTFVNKNEKGKGIWYPNDYRKYLIDECGIEMDESFSTGFANEQFFQKTGIYTFKLRDGKKASEALLSFLEGPTVADCGNVILACYYKCLLDNLGEEKFNKLFNLREFTIGQKIMDSPIGYLADFSESAKNNIEGVCSKRPLKRGEKVTFGGINWYFNKHPTGSGATWNVIYIGDNKEGQQLFVAHGFEKPLTEKEINEKLVELYNRERTVQEEQAIILAKRPEVYDRGVNKNLISHYTISDREIEETPNKFMKGFESDSVIGLQASALLKLRKANDVLSCIRELESKRSIIR